MSLQYRSERHDNTILPTKSASWKCLEAVRSCLSSRLASFKRSHGRPQKRDNDAALFEVDLRNVFNKAPLAAGLSPEDYADMDWMVAELLEVLDEIVNDRLIYSEDERESAGWASHLNDEPYEAELLRHGYPRLSGLITFLEDADGLLNLATGPGFPIFTPPPGTDWSLALQRVATWKDFLERVTASERSGGDQILSMSQTTLASEWRETTRPDVPGKRASILVGAMFREFRRLNCGNGTNHEVKLRVPEDLYTSQRALDLFVSSCIHSDERNREWQEAEGGEMLRLVTEGDIEHSICSAINRARSEGKRMQLIVDDGNRLLIVLSSKPPAQPARLTSKSLSDLLKGRSFHEPKFKDLLTQGNQGTAHLRFGSRNKAMLALSLARCLMDFIDEELELALYSWQPEHIFLLYPEGGDARQGTLCISLKQSLGAPEMDLMSSIRPGNPILLSFARLLLEIYDGDELTLNIHQNNPKLNTGVWGQMCGSLEDAKSNGDGYFLQAVQGCLYLHNSLSQGDMAATGPAAASIIRQHVYKNIVHNLEVTVELASTGQKRQREDADKMVDIPPPKRISVPSASTKPRSPSSGPIDTDLMSDIESTPYYEGDKQYLLPSISPAARRILKPRSWMMGRPLSARTQLDGAKGPEMLAGRVTLYDEEHAEGGSEAAKRAREYLELVDKANRVFILPSHGSSRVTGDDKLCRPVRIAIIDSGIDMTDRLMKRNAQRIKAKRNWTDDDPQNWTDTFGHGTHVARLLVQVAPAAEIYIARVSTAKTILSEKTGLIAQVLISLHLNNRAELTIRAVPGNQVRVHGLGCRHHLPLSRT